MISLDEARTWLAASIATRPPETVPRREAAGRTLAVDTPLGIAPARPTATIDGLALRAADTEGASEYAPISVRGSLVQDGDPLPPGADAVLPHATLERGSALAPVARGHGVAPPGHDVPAGTILPAGTLLTPLHLAALEHDPLVLARPRVAADADFLHAMLMAQDQVAEPGPDRLADLILVTAAPLTTVYADGLAIRPGETTALGQIGATPAIRLPRHPAACATVFTLLVAPTLRRLAGRPEPTPAHAILTRKIASVLGQLDAVRVRLDDGAATPLGPAEGIGLLTAAAADGLVLVPEGSEGYPTGALVPIYPT